MKVFLLFLLLALAGRAFAQSGVTSNLIDTDQSFDVTYVRLDLTARPDTEYIEGSSLIRFVSHGINADSTIQLSLRDIVTADSAYCNGIPTTFTHAGHKLFVKLTDRYPTGTVADVKVYYHGYSRSGAYIHTTQNWKPDGILMIWTGSEPYGARDWWVCKDNPADKIDSADINVTCDTPYSIASNGTLARVEQHGPSRTFYWHESYPIDHYLIAFLCTELTTLSHSHALPDGEILQMTSYVFPASADTMQQSLQLLDTLVDTYSTWFGPYAFAKEKYGMAQWHGGGMENQTISFCNDAGLDILAHETAHQWFGDAITCKTWNDCWLNEGFATYVTDLFTEKELGEKAFRSNIQGEENNVISQAGGSVHMPDSLLDTRALDGRLVYAKGSLVLHMLHFILGDSTFFGALREYQMGPLRYGVASAEDFRTSVEHSTGLDLRQFFQQWVYDEGYPIYGLAWASRDSLHPALAITQRGSNWDSPIFAMPIELEFRGPNFDTTVRVWNDRPLTAYQFSFSKPVGKLTFDPKNWLLDGFLDPPVLSVPGSAESGVSLWVSPDNVAHFGLVNASHVTLLLQDILGRTVATYDQGHCASGFVRLGSTALGTAQGVYLLSLEVDGVRMASCRFVKN